jgi:hypothetical protein
MDNNRDRYVVVNEKLVLFRGCDLVDGRLVKGKHHSVNYSFSTVNNSIVVNLN